MISPSYLVAFLLLAPLAVLGRPIVRHIRSTHEFDRLLSKHATVTGLPVVVDFYSDGCGPCRMIAPIFKKLAKEVEGKAVFVKVDTNAMYELSSRYGVRSLPTFKFFLNGKKVNEFSGAGEAQLRQFTQDVIQRAQFENVMLTRESLTAYYAEKDAAKSAQDVDKVYKKCSDMLKEGNPDKLCVGSAARNLVKSLKKKYGDGPKTDLRFQPEEPKEDKAEGSKGTEGSKPKQKPGKNDSPNLHLASKEELLAELEKRIDAERDAEVEQEDDDEAEEAHSWTPSPFPERVTIIGGGPAGLSAAIYAARAGLKPVVVAPPMGGQLQGKGVDVENYPGLFNVTGPAVVSLMRQQAIEFGATFEAETVIGIDASSRPFKVKTNSSSIETHAVIVATGAESNWLNVKGEYEMRGGGVSSCATCDGHMYRGKHVIVVGGGDTAMEDALVLARTSASVTVIHRRDSFRASKVLAQRVMEHPSISIRWNTILTEVLGKPLEAAADNDHNEDVDLDAPVVKVVSGAIVKDVFTGEETKLDAEAVFVAIGHTPTTQFLDGIVEFDPKHPGYVLVKEGSTRTSVPGIFACGDVADSVYRQAITSAGSGAAAALDAERWLSEEGLGNEEADFEAELLAELMADGGSKNVDMEYNVYEDAGGRMSGMKESIAAEL